MLFFAVVYVTFAIVLSGNSIKKQPQRNENLVFLQTRTDRMLSVPRLFWPRWRQNYFIVSLKKSACWLKGLCGGLNVEGIGESNRQLQLKR